MRVVDGFGNELDVTRGFRGRQRTVAHELGEVLSLDVIHREVVLAVVDAHVVNGDDVRVPEVSRSRDLALEPLNDLLACEPLGQNHLYRDDALEIEMPRAIDHAHPAAGNLFEKLVVGEVPNLLIFAFRFSLFAFRREYRLAGRWNDWFVQAAPQQATSA